MKKLTIISLAIIALTSISAYCGTVSSFPYTESFETGYGDWAVGYNPYTNASSEIIMFSQWENKSGSASPGLSGPSSAYKGEKYVYAFQWPISIMVMENHYLTLTCDFSSVTSPELSFRYFMYGDEMGDLFLNVFDGSWSNLVLISGEQQTSKLDPWRKAIADISYCGGKSEVVIQFIYAGPLVEWVPNAFCALDYVQVYDNVKRIEIEAEKYDLYTSYYDPAVYKINLKNFTGINDNFNLNYESDWNISGPAETGILINEGSTNISVTVTLPQTVQYGVVVTSIFEAVNSDFSITGSAELVTHCLSNIPLYAFSVYVSPHYLSYFNATRVEHPYWEALLDGKYGDIYSNKVFSADFLTNDFSKIYAIISGTNQFVTFSTTPSADINYIGPCVPTHGGYWTDMTIARDGTVYAVTYLAHLYTVNPSTGEATFLREIKNIGITAAIAINRHNEMYAVEVAFKDANLYKIDIETGDSTHIGKLNWDWLGVLHQSYEQGLEFDDYHDTLYWGAKSKSRRDLIIVDTETAAITPVGIPGTPPYRSFDGLAIALPTPGAVINGSFEYYNYTGWTVSGNGAFGIIPRKIQEFNMPKDGKQYANSGYDSNGIFDNSLVGVLQSKVFPLTADEQISMFVGGWSSELGDTNEYNFVSLHRASDNAELDRVYAPNANDASLCLLQHNTNIDIDVYLKIVDDGSGTTNAWISDDDIEAVEYSFVLGDNCGFERGNFQNWTVTGTGWEATNFSGFSGFSDFHGRFFASTFSDGTSTGVLRSASFSGEENLAVTFLMNGFAGSANGSNYVSLILETDGTELARVYPPNSSNFISATLWPDFSCIGSNVYIKIVDNCPDTEISWFGVDDFQVETKEPPTPDLDFETGTYTNWTVSGTAWADAPSTTDYWPAQQVGFNCQGIYYGLSRASGSSVTDPACETATGTIRSVNVTLTGNGIVTFLICGHSKQPAGASNIYNYVTLNRASNGEELDRVYASGHNVMGQRFLQSVSAIGEKVYIEVVDNAPENYTGYAWLGVDDFKFADPITDPGKFEDVSTEVGLTAMYYPAHVDNAIAWGDYNNDGWPDMYLGTYDAGKGVYLFKNNAGTIFENANIPNIAMWWPGIFVDYNNDGFQDIYSPMSGGHLARNQGDGTFLNQDSLLGAFPTQSECAVWADFNNDGRTEFYRTGWEKTYSGPYFPDARWLWNKSSSHFDLDWEQTANTKAGRGVTCADFDEDGDQDIYVSNYRIMANYLWINNGVGNFTDEAAAYGVAGTPAGTNPNPYGHTIGSCFGDLDNDGHLDLVVGNFNHHDSRRADDPKFYRNMGPAGNWHFEDKSSSVALPWVQSHASPALADFDNDGDLDFFITAIAGSGYSGEKCTLMRNDGNWNFTDVSDEYKMRITTPDSNFQAAWADYDNDGDLDIMTGKKLYRNNITNGNHWIKIKMVGDGTNINRDAIGAIVRIPFGAEILTRQVESAMGWGNQNDKTLHFGLGTNSGPVTIITTWPNNHVQTNLFDVEQTVTIIYGINASKINLSGNGYGIINGNTTPSTDNGTDFGVVDIDTFTRNTFDIVNSGNINLTISEISISDTSAFQVTTYPAGSIEPAGSTIFIITFDPEDVLVYSGIVSIANNDITAAPFTFMITGEGIPEPCYLLFIIGNFFFIFLWKNKK